MSAPVRQGIAVLVLALALGGLGIAAAQQTTRTASDTGGATAGVRRESTLTAAEQVTHAQGILSNGQSLSVRIQGNLDQSRREGDVLRVTCLDDKLTQVNAQVRTLSSRVDALQEAVRLRDESRRNHEYTVIIVIGQNLVVLDRSASECIGQDMYETGTTRVVTTIDPSTPTINATQLLGIPVDQVIFIPPPASL